MAMGWCVANNISGQEGKKCSILDVGLLIFVSDCRSNSKLIQIGWKHVNTCSGLYQSDETTNRVLTIP